MEKQYWWKITGIILMLFVLYRGLLTPLKHGITSANPDRIHSDTVSQLNIHSYNSNYLATANDVQVYLKHVPEDSKNKQEEFLIRAEHVDVVSDVRLNAKFNIPKYLPDSRKVALFSIIVDDPKDGATAIPSKIIILQDSVDLTQGIKSWTLNDKPHFHFANKYDFPYRNILVETIRNTFFHVSLWFSMFLMFGMSVYYSVRYLKSNDPDADLRSFALVRTGLFFGIMGCLTGSLWARFTWETWWTTDIKLNMAALTILIYLSYLVLRSAIEDKDRKARITSAYNIFALVAVIPLIFILPRLTDSLHPGNGGNPAFGSDDMDNSLRMIFYPAVLAFMMIGLWMASLLYRMEKIRFELNEKDNN